MMSYKNLSDEKLKGKIDNIEIEKSKLEEQLKGLKLEGKKMKLTLNQKELAKQRRLYAKIDLIIGKTFLASTQPDNIARCIAKVASEKERIFVQDNIEARLVELRGNT